MQQSLLSESGSIRPVEGFTRLPPYNLHRKTGLWSGAEGDVCKKGVAPEMCGPAVNGSRPHNICVSVTRARCDAARGSTVKVTY